MHGSTRPKAYRVEILPKVAERERTPAVHLHAHHPVSSSNQSSNQSGRSYVVLAVGDDLVQLADVGLHQLRVLWKGKGQENEKAECNLQHGWRTKGKGKKGRTDHQQLEDKINQQTRFKRSSNWYLSDALSRVGVALAANQPLDCRKRSQINGLEEASKGSNTSRVGMERT